MPAPSGDTKASLTPRPLILSFSSATQSTMSLLSAMLARCQEASPGLWSCSRTQKDTALLLVSGRSFFLNCYNTNP